MKKLLYILLFVPVALFGQDNFTSNCNNGYFKFYCTECNDIYMYDPEAFVVQESDSTNIIIWTSLTGGETSLSYTPMINIVNEPGNAWNKLSGIILSNDDVLIASGENVNRISPSQDQFNLDISDGSSNLTADLNWESIYDFSSSGCGNGSNPNTNFCEGDNGDVYFAHCNNGMTNIIKITNDTIIEVIADSLPGNRIKSLAFHNSTLYVANADYVYKYNSNIVSDLNFQTSVSQGPNHFSAIATLELNNNGIPYVVSSDTSSYGVVYKYFNNSWHQIDNNFNFFVEGYSRDFLDFDTNNNGYLLGQNVGSAGLSLFKIVNDSVNLFKNFHPIFEMNQNYYAMELDNYGNPYIGFIKDYNQLGLIKYDGIDWLTILNHLTLNPDGHYDYLDLQFNSFNDLYMMYEGESNKATVITFCDCDLQPYNYISIEEKSKNKELLKVTDLLGRETKQTNQPLFYIYDDGTVEKRITIE